MGFYGIRVGFRTVLGSTHVVEQLLFSTLTSILTFDFGVIFYFLAPQWAESGAGLGFKYCFGVHSLC